MHNVHNARDVRQVKLRNGKVKLELCKRTQRSLDHPSGQSSWIYDGHNEIVNYGNSDIQEHADNRGSFMKMNATAFSMKPAPVPNEKSLCRMQLLVWFRRQKSQELA